MASRFDKVIELLRSFSQEDLKTIIDMALQKDVPVDSKEDRVCPHCGSSLVVKNGHKCGKQSYLCRECHSSFTTTTMTVMYKSHYGIDVWEGLFNDTIAGHSLSYSEERLNLTHQTAFNMRHKLLLALQDIENEAPTVLEDVVELDETFVLESYKGKALSDEIGRKPRKHGAKASKRGISNEYICLCAGVQRKSEAIVRSVNRAKPSKNEIETVFSGHIADGSLVLTDGLRSYSKITQLADCSLKDINQEKSSFYNLSSVNNLHSFIKRRYDFYRAVATKYLNRYCAAFAVGYRHSDQVIDRLKSTLFGMGKIRTPHTCRDVRGMCLYTV